MTRIDEQRATNFQKLRAVFRNETGVKRNKQVKLLPWQRQGRIVGVNEAKYTTGRGCVVGRDDLSDAFIIVKECRRASVDVGICNIWKNERRSHINIAAGIQDCLRWNCLAYSAKQPPTIARVLVLFIP